MLEQFLIIVGALGCYGLGWLVGRSSAETDEVLRRTDDLVT